MVSASHCDGSCRTQRQTNMYIPVVIASTLGIFAFRIIGQSWARAILSYVAVIAVIAACYGLAVLTHLIKP